MADSNLMWLVLEPYVHGTVSENDALLYNSVNKTCLVSKGSEEIAGKVRQLLDPQNGYVIKIQKEEAEQPPLRKFIAGLQKKFMGDVLDPAWSASKPFNIVPEPLVKPKTEELSNYLGEITFQVNSSALPQLENFKRAHLQFPFPIYSEGPGDTLSVSTIRAVAVMMESLPMATINFVGSGIYRDPLYSQLASVFKSTAFRTIFHIPLWDLSLPVPGRLSKNEQLAIYVTFPVDPQQLELLDAMVRKYPRKGGPYVNFVVQTSHEADQAMEIISTLGLRRVFFKPCLNGENMQFFREQVFISEEDIMASKPTQNQIFSRLTMNEHDFGKLTVFPNGDVYANANDKPLGNLADLNVEELVGRERAGNTSWSRRRTEVEPCRDCLYRFLCPPVSNYEILSKKFNFCHIHP